MFGHNPVFIIPQSCDEFTKLRREKKLLALLIGGQISGISIPRVQLEFLQHGTAHFLVHVLKPHLHVSITQVMLMKVVKY